MIKTLTIGDKDVRLDNNIGWTLEYRDQFGRDIVPAIMPFLSSIISTIGGVFEEFGTESTDIGVAEVIQAISGERASEIMIQLSQLELTDFINVVWALAKNADPTLPEPKRWVRQFDPFPLDELIPEVGKLIIAGMASQKNLKWLQTKADGLKPKQ